MRQKCRESFDKYLFTKYKKQSVTYRIPIHLSFSPSNFVNPISQGKTAFTTPESNFTERKKLTFPKVS